MSAQCRVLLLSLCAAYTPERASSLPAVSSEKSAMATVSRATRAGAHGVELDEPAKAANASHASVNSTAPDVELSTMLMREVCSRAVE